jgi:hypothetical protein
LLSDQRNQPWATPALHPQRGASVYTQQLRAGNAMEEKPLLVEIVAMLRERDIIDSMF